MANAVLAAGDRVAAVSLSGPSEPAQVRRGVERLAERYDVVLDPRALASTGFLAGGDAERAESLIDALEDRDIRGVVCVRGGYGATRVLARHGARIAAALARDPKPIAGFSDVTAMHALWARVGARSVHGPMIARMGAEAGVSDEDRASLCAALEGEGSAFGGLDRWVSGECEGVARGGNLAVLAALVGTPYAPSFDGAVVFLEDVGERPYRVDRMLTQLLASGAFDGARGVVLGEWVDCAPGPYGVSVVEQVLRERLGGLGVPLWAGAPFGHGARCRAFALGARVTVTSDGEARFEPEPDL
jgi:muramoyltetrapeptide carboxypeptidase